MNIKVVSTSANLDFLKMGCNTRITTNTCIL